MVCFTLSEALHGDSFEIVYVCQLFVLLLPRELYFTN